MKRTSNSYATGVNLNAGTQFQVVKFTGSKEESFQNVLLISSAYKRDESEHVWGLKALGSNTVHYYPIKYCKSMQENQIGMSALLMTTYKRSYFHSLTNALKKRNSIDEPITRLSCEIADISSAARVPTKINTESLKAAMRKHLGNYPICLGQSLYLPFSETEAQLNFEIKITSVNNNTSANTSYQLLESSEIIIKSLLDNKKNITLITDNAIAQSLSMDFALKGVGGHKKQLESLVRDIFYSRAMPADYAQEYGTNHSKGILLFGPPGTGKTLIGRVIGSMLTEESKIKVINGPELKNKFVGESAKNVRDIFIEANQEWAEKGLNSATYVYIFDELDALCPPRGAISGTKADEDIVSTLLTQLDGIKQQHNIVIIGTTNRPDLIDSAMKRPGRLECLFEIGLPDETARLEILHIKTETMRKVGLMDSNLQLAYWAERSLNYTGAELEQLVKKAVHYAMGENFSIEGTGGIIFSKNIKNKNQLAKVNYDHFQKAFNEIQPAFGVDKQLNQFQPERFILYSSIIENTLAEFNKAVTLLRSQEDIKSYQYLITGPSGSGKTNLAYYLANQTDAKYIKVISVEHILSLPLAKQLDYVIEQFDNANRVALSVLILDDLENLIGADADLLHYNNALRIQILNCLKNLGQSDNKCIVIATAQNATFIQRMGLMNSFNECTNLPLIAAHNSTILSKLFKSFDYELLIPQQPLVFDAPTMELPIGSFLYKIKKYLFEKASEQPIQLIDFFTFLNLAFKVKNRPKISLLPDTFFNENNDENTGQDQVKQIIIGNKSDII